MRSRRDSSLAAQPVLVGAITVLITVVVIFIAYNANRGLPFVPLTELRFESASGAALTKGNQVKEGGKRIGFVDDMRPARRPDGRVVAEITIKLDEAAGRIPRDSTVAIRPQSLSGLKYVELTRGRSRDALDDGDVIELGGSRVPVQVDDVQNTYDVATRLGVQSVLQGGGETLVGRGVAINEALGDLPRLLEHLEPVARTLGDPDTRLDRLLESLERTVGAIAPVADRYAHGFSAGADTFEAWSRDPASLEETSRRSWRTLRDGIPSLRVQQPFLRHARDFSRALRGAAEVMPRALPRIEAALDRGVDVQRELPRLNAELSPTLVSLEELAADRRTTAALRGIDHTVDLLRPLTRFVGPYVTVCNAFNYAFTYASEAGMEPAAGRGQRTLVLVTPNTEDRAENPDLGQLGARRPLNGEPVADDSPVKRPANLHLNVYPAAIDDRGEADCESGQRGYVERVARSAPADRKIVIDPHVPGNQGPPYVGRPRVPRGQTFSRTPESGPRFPRELAGR